MALVNQTQTDDREADRFGIDGWVYVREGKADASRMGYSFGVWKHEYLCPERIRKIDEDVKREKKGRWL